MLTSAVSSSRWVACGSVSVGVSDATRTGSVLTLRWGGARATWRWTRLSLAVGKRSLNCGFGKRSSKLSPAATWVAACEFAASMPAFGSLPH